MDARDAKEKQSPVCIPTLWPTAQLVTEKRQTARTGRNAVGQNVTTVMNKTLSKH